jgi:hypothetical protein
MDRKYRSEAMEPIYESALANFSIGAISEERFREYERACFVSESPDMEAQGCQTPWNAGVSDTVLEGGNAGVSDTVLEGGGVQGCQTREDNEG